MLVIGNEPMVDDALKNYKYLIRKVYTWVDDYSRDMWCVRTFSLCKLIEIHNFNWQNSGHAYWLDQKYLSTRLCS